MPRPSKFRVPAGGGHPALVMCYRAQLPDPPAHGKAWSTVRREFTVPEKVTVRGKVESPLFIALKAVVYDAPPSGGKSFFDNFRLVKVK